MVVRGDIVQLGVHRLMCGDAFSADDTSALLQGETPDIVFTDPPYNVGGTMSKGLFTSKDKTKHAWLGDAMRDLTDAKWDQGFSTELLCESLERIKPLNGTVYVCASHRTAPAIWNWMDHSGAGHSSYCVWCKPNPMPSLRKRHPTWATELICYATYGKHVFNFPAKGHAYNYWNLSKNTPHRIHPTQKPESLAGQALSYSSNPGSLVVDLFAGSGSTLFAAESLGRRAYISEINPKYCQLIIDRYHSLKAVA